MWEAREPETHFGGSLQLHKIKNFKFLKKNFKVMASGEGVKKNCRMTNPNFDKILQSFCQAHERLLKKIFLPGL